MPQARRKRGAEGALAPPVFGRTVNPMYLNQGEQIMPTTVLRAPPDFQILRRPCFASSANIVKLFWNKFQEFYQISWFHFDR